MAGTNHLFISMVFGATPGPAVPAGKSRFVDSAGLIDGMV
jgi:hypothetical protein